MDTRQIKSTLKNMIAIYKTVLAMKEFNEIAVASCCAMLKQYMICIYDGSNVSRETYNYICDFNILSGIEEHKELIDTLEKLF